MICGFDRRNWRGWVEWEWMMKEYSAPWGWSLRIVSALATAGCGVGAVLMWCSDQLLVRWLAWLPLAVIVGSMLFLIRGYRVTSQEIWVRRLFWCTRVSLAELMSARVESEAMRWSVGVYGGLEGGLKVGGSGGVSGGVGGGVRVVRIEGRAGAKARLTPTHARAQHHRSVVVSQTRSPSIV